MKIDKEHWNIKNATRLNNIEYQLYINDFIEECNEYPDIENDPIMFQTEIVGWGFYYGQAKQILRKEKIDKLKENINGI